MSQRKRAAQRSGSQIEEEQHRRVKAAEHELQAILDRHRVVLAVEQGTSSQLGNFTRFVFYAVEDGPPKKEKPAGVPA